MSDNVHILQLAAYEAPVIKEAKRENWVEFGEDNDYYKYLIDCYTNSTTNNAIINNVSRLIYGKGLSATDASKKPSEYAQMFSLFHKDCVRQLCVDLKMLGQCAMQVIYTKDRKKIAAVHHMPVQLLRAEKCNEEGKIEAYYYSDDWSDVRNYVPKRISAFGCSNDELEILFIKPYSVGLKYYSLPDYVGSTPYCTLEESISEYLINEVENGFSGRAVINFNNGQPSQEEQIMIKSKVLNQLTGTQGEKVIISFNNNSESATTVDSMPVNDAPDLYNTLAEECLRKIMLGHQVTSPLLFGIASQNGFSSNADELKNSYILFQNMVINPMRQLLTDAFDQILAYNDISLKLYFEELQPLTADGDLTKTDEAEQTMSALNSLSPLVANKVLENMTPDEIRALVGLKKGAVTPDVTLKKDLTDDEGDHILKNLEGENISDVWELVDEREYSEENSDLDNWIENLESKNKSTLQKFADIIKSYPNRKSALDKSIYKVRYKYTEKYSSGNTRDFCKQMMTRTNSGVVYRKEDIDMASFQGVNNEFGHKGQNYSLFRFKGGVNCGHFWTEQLYKLKKKADGTYYEDKALSSSEEVSSIPSEYKPSPAGSRDSKIAPKDMPNNGHHPNYKG
jgi:hypothetical protein